MGRKLSGEKNDLRLGVICECKGILLRSGLDFDFIFLFTFSRHRLFLRFSVCLEIRCVVMPKHYLEFLVAGMCATKHGDWRRSLPSSLQLPEVKKKRTSHFYERKKKIFCINYYINKSS